MNFTILKCLCIYIVYKCYKIKYIYIIIDAIFNSNFHLSNNINNKYTEKILKFMVKLVEIMF